MCVCGWVGVGEWVWVGVGGWVSGLARFSFCEGVLDYMHIHVAMDVGMINVFL